MPTPPPASTRPRTGILRGSSEARCPVDAVAELAQQIGRSPAALRVVYCSPDYDPALLAAALTAHFADAPLLGCTTAGEIGPAGYLANPGLSGVSLPAEDFQVDVQHLRGLRELDLPSLAALASTLAETHRARGGAGRSFGLLLADGLSMREELLASAVHSRLGGLPLCGGSAGDGLRFQRTLLYVDGRFEQDAATVALIRTARPFEIFKRQHFDATPAKLVVTAADPARRVVHELDGEPAAVAYARAIGVAPDQLSPAHFSAHPVVVRVGGSDFVRSIQHRTADDSLVFYCAIDDGLVLSLATGRDLAADLRAQADQLSERLGTIELTLGFDCILRRLESKQRGLVPAVDAELRRLALCGFATYGEQVGAMHVNQTLTGVAIGAAAAP
jgi:hypothetical protein